MKTQTKTLSLAVFLLGDTQTTTAVNLNPDLQTQNHSAEPPATKQVDLQISADSKTALVKQDQQPVQKKTAKQKRKQERREKLKLLPEDHKTFQDDPEDCKELTNPDPIKKVTCQSGWFNTLLSFFHPAMKLEVHYEVAKNPKKTFT